MTVQSRWYLMLQARSVLSLLVRRKEVEVGRVAVEVASGWEGAVGVQLPVCGHFVFLAGRSDWACLSCTRLFDIHTHHVLHIANTAVVRRT